MGLVVPASQVCEERLRLELLMNYYWLFLSSAVHCHRPLVKHDWFSNGTSQVW